MEKQRLLNVYVNNLTMMESVNRIHDMIREKQTSYVVEVNVDVVMKMEKDPYLKKISQTSQDKYTSVFPGKFVKQLRYQIGTGDLFPDRGISFHFGNPD